MRRVAAHLGVAGAGAAPPNVKVDVVGLLLRLNVKDDLGISPDMVSGTLCDEAFGRERAKPGQLSKASLSLASLFCRPLGRLLLLTVTQ